MTVDHGSASNLQSSIAARADDLLRESQFRSNRRIDYMFAVLMILQWVGAILATLFVSPYTWIGERWEVHLHVWLAVLLGCVITSLPVLLAVRRPGETLTRYVIAVAQVSFSCLLIHVTGGRIETHFHIFGSLAFLAAYRDWRVLVCASIVVATDHLARGVFWPQSVFGVLTSGPWRWVEHTLWVVFENVFLIIGCVRSRREMVEVAWRTAELESSHTEAEKQAVRLTQEKTARESLIEQAPEVVVTMDSAGRVIGWNRQGQETFGWSASEAIGTNCETLLIPETLRSNSKNCFAWIGRNLEPRLNVQIESVVCNRQNEEFPVEVSFVAIQTENELQYCGFIRDISARNDYEAGLEAARIAAEESSRTKTHFLTNMSHEIRTPLTAIMGFNHVLRFQSDAISAEEREELLAAVESSAGNLLSLVNDLFDLTKIEAGQIAIIRDRCDPDMIISEVVDAFRTPARSKRLELDSRWSSPVPASIRTDPLRLSQILTNLVSNAVKFTDSGSVDIEAKIEQVDRQPPQLVIAVKDTGIGIPEGSLEKVFHPFEQVDGSVTRRYGGTGLGLAVSRRLAKEMNGSLTVESRTGYGSVFTLKIDAGKPMSRRSNGVSDDSSVARLDQSSSPTTPGSGKPDLTGFRIMLCEDKPENRKLLEFLISSAGGHVEIAVNGRDGVDLATRQDFDIIIMDMQMPVMDGYTATRTLRSEGLDIPIVAVTAHAMAGAEQKCLEAGCTKFVPKPFNPRDLLSLLKQLIEEHAAVSDSAS